MPVGAAAAPAAPQSTAQAPAPGSTAAPWLIDGAAPGFKQTSSEPPVAVAAIWPMTPCGPFITPLTFFEVRRITQPSVTVTFTNLPCWSNSSLNLVFGAIHKLPRGPSLIVAPTPSGVSIVAPLGIVAPLIALAPLTVIGLLLLVVRMPISCTGTGSGTLRAEFASANVIPT